MELLRELIEEYSEHIPLMEAIGRSVRSLSMMKAGGKIAAKGAGDFFKANPALVVGAATLALDAYGKYKRNKRNTIRLHAKDPYEKKMMRDIVDSLTKSGKYKVERMKMEHGGRTWILKKKWG